MKREATRDDFHAVDLDTDRRSLSGGYSGSFSMVALRSRPQVCEDASKYCPVLSRTAAKRNGRAQPSAPAFNLEFRTETALYADDRHDAANSDTHAPLAAGLAREEKTPRLPASDKNLLRSLNPERCDWSLRSYLKADQ
jgi:hypothetical protein